ncbi:MAG: hypothetical protein Q9174_005843 [Haloplaca sp. 1 TL-2023]
MEVSEELDDNHHDSEDKNGMWVVKEVGMAPEEVEEGAKASIDRLTKKQRRRFAHIVDKWDKTDDQIQDLKD